MAGPYVNPIPSGAVNQGIDQGVDFKGKTGDPILAIGKARIDLVHPFGSGFAGGGSVYYTLLEGPYRGRQIYVGEALPSKYSVPGHTVAAGTPVAYFTDKPLSQGRGTGLTNELEIGFARGNLPLAGYDPNNPGARTGPGVLFQNFLNTLSRGGAVRPVTPTAGGLGSNLGAALGVDPTGGPVIGGTSGGAVFAPGGSVVGSITGVAGDVGGAVSGAAGSVGGLFGSAFGSLASVFGAPLDFLKALWGLLTTLFDPNFWIRVLEIFGGSVLIFGGVYLLAKQIGLTQSIPSSAGPAAKVALAAEGV